MKFLAAYQWVSTTHDCRLIGNDTFAKTGAGPPHSQPCVFLARFQDASFLKGLPPAQRNKSSFAGRMIRAAGSSARR